MFGLRSTKQTAAKRAAEARERYSRVQAKHEEAKREATAAREALAEEERNAVRAVADGAEVPRLAALRRRLGDADGDVVVFGDALAEASRAVEAAEREELEERQREGEAEYRRAVEAFDKALEKAAEANERVEGAYGALPFPGRVPRLSWSVLRRQGDRHNPETPLATWRAAVERHVHPPRAVDPVAEGGLVLVRVLRSIGSRGIMGRRVPSAAPGETLALAPDLADDFASRGIVEVARDERPAKLRGRAHLKPSAAKPEEAADGVELF